MDAHHNWWGIGFMVFMVVVGISLLLILMDDDTAQDGKKIVYRCQEHTSKFNTVLVGLGALEGGN